MPNPAELIIYSDRIRENIMNIKRFCGNQTQLIPVVKANSYGLGIENLFPIMLKCGISCMAVSCVEEGLQLRKLGFHGDIIILIQSERGYLIHASDSKLILSIGSLEFLQQCALFAKTNEREIFVNLELDVGMNRTGLPLEQVIQFISLIKRSHFLHLWGISGHLSNNENIACSHQQIKQFNDAVKIVGTLVDCSLLCVSLLSSGGLFRYANDLPLCNAVRCGISLYGYYPANVDCNLIALKPSLVLKSHISFIRHLKKGSRIGYNGYQVNRDSTIAIVPIGFYDALIGYDPPGGFAVVNRERAEIISICMDVLMIDVTNIMNISVGLDVYIWDNELVTLNDWAFWCNSSIYEIIPMISNRVERCVI